MATCITLPAMLYHENVIPTASLHGSDARGCDTRSSAFRVRPNIIARKYYLQVTAISERTAPVVEVAINVRVTQHDGDLHPHSAASSVVDRQGAKVELQPVFADASTCGIHVLGIGERAPLRSPCTVDGGFSYDPRAVHGFLSRIGTNTVPHIADPGPRGTGS